MTSPAGPVWVTAVALSTLAQQQLGAGSEFTAPQLAEWTARELSPEQRVHASSRLCHLDFVRHSVEVVDGRRVDTYRITLAGAAAIEAAAAGHVRKSGPKTTRQPNPPKTDALATRLWALLRMRRALDSDEAAQTLCTAGQDKFETVRDSVQRYLRRWSQAGFVEESAKRVGGGGTSNGFKRYVLVTDSGPTPPRWRPVLRNAQEVRS